MFVPDKWDLSLGKLILSLPKWTSKTLCITFIFLLLVGNIDSIWEIKIEITRPSGNVIFKSKVILIYYIYIHIYLQYKA